MSKNKPKFSNKKTILLLSVTCMFLISCGKAKDAATGDDSVSDSASLVESSITAVSGVADDQSESSYAHYTPIKSKYDFISQMLIEPTFAANCSRALASNCNNGVRSATLSSCTLGASNLKATGDINLTYSSSSCDMSATNATVTRTYNYDISGPRGGGVITNSSDSHTDYNGNQIGGGAKITKLATGFQIDILGKHKIFNLRSKKLFDISVKSDASNPLVFTSSLSRNQRQLQSGKLVVSHNLAKYTAEFTLTNLKWTSVCCHPVEGQISVVYSGSKTGQSTVSFTSCGMAQMEKDGQIEQLELSYCE